MDQPVRSQGEVRRFVEDLIGYATNPGQLWLLFLDGDRFPLPTQIPFEHVSAIPDEYLLDQILRSVADLVGNAALGSLVFALERWGGPEITASDREWARLLGELSDRAGLQVAGVVLCTPDSVRTLPLPHHRPGIGEAD